MTDTREQCAVCGTRLAADNTGDVCSPCSRAGRGPRGLPNEFWDSETVVKAVAARDFGQLLLAIRQASYPPLKQSDIADRLGITQSQISRIERGASVVRDLAKLERWSVMLEIPQKRLWFSISPKSGDEYEIGLSAPDAYSNAPAKPSFAVESHGEGGGSVDRRQFIKATGVAATMGVGSSLLQRTSAVAVSSPRDRIGDPDVDLVREVTAAFRKVDNKYGGAHSRSAVDAYMSATVQPMLKAGRMRDRVRAELFTAAAELQQLAGWMCYDTGRTNEGRMHLRTALRLCQEVGDDAMSAEMLAGLSHQAAFYKSPDHALDLAMAAKQSARRTGIAALKAESAVMEAHALSLLGDRANCLKSLSEVEDLASNMAADIPEWLAYFDTAYVAAKFAHTFHNLGDLKESESFARRSLEMSDGFDRGRLFNTALLATVLADAGKVDESCAVGAEAVELSNSVRSTRGLAYLDNISRSLARHSRMPEVRDFNSRLRSVGIEPAEI